MRDLSYKLAELGPLLRPVARYAIWPVSFLLTRAINQEPFYLLAIFLVLAADVIDTPQREKALFLDFAGGAMTVVLALAISDLSALLAGGVVAIAAISTLLWKSARSVRSLPKT